MKKAVSLQEAKQKITDMLGKSVTVRICRGRNRVKHYSGVLSETHANVFVVELLDCATPRISCSYTDVLCGEVTLCER